MQLDRRYAWVAFCMACSCVVSALVYVWMSNRQGGGDAGSSDGSGVSTPQYVPATVPQPVVTAGPSVSSTPVTLPSAAPVTSAELVRVYPGGWVWNPHFHRWDARRNRWDPYWGYHRGRHGWDQADPYWKDRWDSKKRRGDKERD